MNKLIDLLELSFAVAWTGLVFLLIINSPFANSVIWEISLLVLWLLPIVVILSILEDCKR